MKFASFDPDSTWDPKSSFVEYLNNHPQESNIINQFIELINSQDRCFYRDLFTPGHFTSSAWVVSNCGKFALMAHHKKLDKWLQLGGHADGDSNLLRSACREVEEEGGITPESVLCHDKKPILFDIDLHDIPAFGDELAHKHFDCRFLFKVDKNLKITCSDESNDLRWIAVEQMYQYTKEPSILRMVEKLALFF